VLLRQLNVIFFVSHNKIMCIQLQS
jgi:hypothetical protein